MSVSSSATALWKAVVDRESELLEDTNQTRKWKIASHLRDECSVCEEKGGVLIGCASERCTKYVHLDCANQVEGLMLDEDGIFTFECEKHNKPPVFCSCKQKYDNTKEYICCDSCFEWYHHTCQKVTAEQKDDSKYICSFCTATQNSGKSVSQELKDGNLDKETRSNDMIRSEKIIGFILPLVLDVCPLIDVISGQSSDLMKVGDVQEAIKLLTSSINNLAAHGFEDPADEELLQKLGVIDVFNQWLNICEDFSSRWNEWKQGILQLSSDLLDTLSRSLWENNGQQFIELEKRMAGIEDERKSNFKAVEEDLESYQLFSECMVWATDFLQAFFAASKLDNWTQSIGSHTRIAQSKLLKKLNNLKKDDIAISLSQWFRPMVQEVENMVNAITRWHNNVCSVILGKDANWEIQEAENFIAESDAFPSMPPLRNDLDDVYREAFKIVDKFEEFLSSSIYSEEIYAQLMDEKDDIGLKLAFEDELDCIKEHGVFLRAFGMVSAEGRIHITQAKILIANAQSVEEDAAAIMKNNFPIAQALHQQLQQVREKLQTNVAEAEKLIGSLMVESVESLDASQLSVFQQLSIITEEEEYLVFCKDADEAHEGVGKILSKVQVTTLSHLDELTDKIRSLVNNDMIPDLESIRQRKTFLRSDLSQLSSMLQTANREWEKLSSAQDDAKEGLAVSAEVVQATLRQCRETQIANDELEQEILQKLKEGEVLSRECENALDTFTQVSDEALMKLEALVERVRHNFIASATGTQIKLRFEAMKTVLSCQRFLQDDHVANEKQTSVKAVAQKLNEMRELKMSLLRLSSVLIQDSLEATMIETVRDRFLYQQWCAEVRDVLTSDVKTSVAHAQRLLDDTASMHPRIQEASEYRELLQAVEFCRQLQIEAQEAQEEFQSMLQGFEIPSEYFQSAMDVVVDESQPQPPQPPTNRLTELMNKGLTLATKWSSVAKSLLLRVRHSLSAVEKAHIMDGEISEKVFRLSRGMEVIENIFAMFYMLEESLSSSNKDALSSASIVMPTFDAKIITDYQNTVYDSLPGSIPLVSELLRVLDIINNQVHRFVETYVNLVPAFFTRQRNNNRLDSTFASKETLVSVLMEPIARAIRTPIHTRLHQVWNQVMELRTKITDFAIQPNQVAKISVGTQGVEEEESQLKNDMTIIENLVQEAELIPLELPESKVLFWLKDLFEWIDRIPLPNTADFEIDYEEALTCKKEATPLIQEIPGATIVQLIDIGVMDTDEQGSPSGFVADAHPRLQNVGDYFEHLDKQIGMADAFSLKVERILANEVQLKDVEQLMKEKESLVVLPPRGCLRMLERALEMHRQKKVASTTAFVQQKVEKKMTSKMTEAAATAAQGQKKSSRLCARTGCGHGLRLPITGAFCSDTCAVKSIEELTRGIVKYKTAIQAQKQAAAVGAQVAPLSQIGHRTRADDVKAFDLNPMKKTVDGILASAANGATADDGKSPRASSTTATTAASTNHALSEVLHRLPAIAHDILRLDKWKEKTAAAVGTAPATAGSKDRSFRTTVRSTLEDIFNTVLAKVGAKASPFHAAIMAMEIEQGMYDKYDQSIAGEYQKHFRMLNTNMKRPNNEYLIKQLAEGELAVKELLNMTVKQFADQELQQQRELQKEAMAKSTIIEVNRDDELERRRREAMSGATEAWRDRSETATSSAEEFNNGGGSDSLAASTEYDLNTSSAMMVDTTEPSPSHGSVSSPGSNTSSSHNGGFFRSHSNDGDSAEGVAHVHGPGALKRSLSDGSEDRGYGGGGGGSKKPRVDGTHPSPRRQTSTELTGPSLLQRLKENSDLTRSTSGESMDDTEDADGREEDEEDIAARKQEETLRRLMEEDTEKDRPVGAKHVVAGGSHGHGGVSASSSSSSTAAAASVSSASKSSSAPKHNLVTTPSMRLVNVDGNEQFSITRPSGAAIRASALVSDKRVQGLVKGTFNIDGRTKIADLERFLGEVLAHGKKTVAVAMFLVPTDASSPANANTSSGSYQKFIEEFTVAERAGLCNAGNGAQVYLVPPILQSQISILRDIRMDSFPRLSTIKPADYQHQLLFAVIVAKELGPPQYINRNYPPLPLAPNSFAVATGLDAKAAPALLPVASAAPMTGGPSFQRPTAFDAMPRPLLAATAPLTAASTSAISPEKEQMRQVAETCARKGPQYLDELRASPANRFNMPFIYDGNHGYDDFKSMIIEFARSLAQQTATNASAAMAPRPLGMGAGMIPPPIMGNNNMAGLRPPMMNGPRGFAAAPMAMPNMMPNPMLQPPQSSSVGGFPRPTMNMGGPRPNLPSPTMNPQQQLQQPPTFPGQAAPRRSRFT